MGLSSRFLAGQSSVPRDKLGGAVAFGEKCPFFRVFSVFRGSIQNSKRLRHTANFLRHAEGFARQIIAIRRFLVALPPPNF